MNLDDIDSGALCIIDTNVLLYAEQGRSAQAQRLLRRCGSGEVNAVLPQPVWQELAHKLMLAEALMKKIVSGNNPAAKLAAKAAEVQTLGLYRQKLRALRDLGLGFEACKREDLFDSAQQLQEKYGLLVNDSVILAISIRMQADALVSSDTAFRQIDEIPVFAPTDLRTT